MAQDERGFMWFGTENGLYRYDGSRFQAWTLKDGLPAALIEHLCLDAAGRLWLGTYSGLAVKDPAGVRVYGPETGLPSSRVLGLWAERGERIWVINDNGPFQKKENDRFEPVLGWPGGNPTAMTGIPGGSEAWVSFTRPGHCGVYRWSKGKWEEVLLEEAAEEPIERLVVAGDGTVWLRSNQMLWSKKTGDGVFKMHPLRLSHVKQAPALYVDPDGAVWVPTDRGIAKILGGKCEELTNREGFTPKVIQSLFVDGEGSMWIGGNNLNRVLGRGMFRHWHSAQGLPSDVVWVILRDSLGRLLVGTDGGLAVAGARGFETVPGSEGFQVRSAVLGTDNAVYATGHTQLLRWHPSSERAERFGADHGFLPGGRVFRLSFAPDGSLWFATESTGLIRAEFVGGEPRFRQVVVPGGDERERFTDIWFDEQERMWAAGASGLAVLENGRWYRFGKKDGLKIDQTAFIRPKKEGGMLLGYFAAPGLTHLRYESGAFQVIGHYDDVFPSDQVVYYFGEDAFDGLWLGTGNGIYIRTAEGRVEHFTLNDGLASENMSNMSMFSEADGTVWFGTTTGLHRFDARQYKGFAKPPRTSILEVRYGGVVTAGETLVSAVIPAADNTIECRFAAPSSIREGAVQCQARLVGFENEWRNSANCEERYPKLPPGRYTFEARARIGAGEYGQPASWSFEILPTWYQSVWFKVLLVLASLLAVAGLVSWRVGALRRRNLTLQKMVEERTSELNRVNEQLRSQSLTDPLTGLKNRRYLGACMTEDVAQVKRVYRSVVTGQKDRLQLNIDLIFLMVDIDFFKSVNDRYGHGVGDLVLQQVASIIREKTRDTDTVVRWGGEEFLVVARNAAREDAHLLAERIRSGIEAHHFDLGNGVTIRKTCSVGFSFYPFNMDDPDMFHWEKIVDLADHCLYAAKRSGRNAWVGLYSGDEADRDSLTKDIDLQVERLVQQGKIRIKTSLPDGARIAWDAGQNG